MPTEEPRAMREVHAWRAKLHAAMEGMSQAERLEYIKARAEHLLALRSPGTARQRNAAK